MLRNGSVLLIAMMLAGCSYGCKPCVNTNPIATAPSANVLIKIQSLNDNEVDQWMEAEYKLHQKLKDK